MGYLDIYRTIAPNKGILCIKTHNNCSMMENIPPKGVSFSVFLLSLPCHIRVLLVFFSQH